VAAVGTNRSNDSELEFSQGRINVYLSVSYNLQDKQHKICTGRINNWRNCN